MMDGFSMVTTPFFERQTFIPSIKSFISGTCAKTLFAIMRSNLPFFFTKSFENSSPKNFLMTLCPFDLATFAAKLVGSIPKSSNPEAANLSCK